MMRPTGGPGLLPLQWLLLVVAIGLTLGGIFRPAKATPRLGAIEIELEKTLSRSLTKYGENPHLYTIQNEYHGLLSQSMADGTIWVMYNHCPEGDEFVANEEYRRGRVGSYYIGCEAHFARYDPKTGSRIGSEVVFADFDAYPQQRNQAFFVHGPDDGAHANTIVLGVWAAQCKNVEDVCLCTDGNCGFDRTKNANCSASWRGKPGATYCQSDDWLGGKDGTGWSCGKEKYNVGTLMAPVNGGQIPAKLYLVKLKEDGELIYSKEAFYFDGGQNEATGDFFGKVAKYTDPETKQEVDDWVYGWIFSTNMGNICNYHWGCQGKVYRASDGEQVESRLWCSHCNGRHLGFDDENKRFGFSCGTDGGPGVFFNGNKVIGRGQTENINTAMDNTHRDNHPVVSHFRGDVWLILYKYIATELDSDPTDLRLLQYDAAKKEILFSKVMTETPTISEGGDHHLEKFGDQTWLMVWSAGRRAYAAEIDAWGNYIGDIQDITDYVNLGLQSGWWHWPNGDVGFVGAWDWQGSPYEEDTQCNKCCEMRERYTIEQAADGGRQCPYEDGYIKTRPCKDGNCPKLEFASAEQDYTNENFGPELGIDKNRQTQSEVWTRWGYGGHAWYKVHLSKPSVVSGVNLYTNKDRQQRFGLAVLFYNSDKALIGRCFINLNNMPSGKDTEEPVDKQACRGLQMYGVKTVMLIPEEGGTWSWIFVREIDIFGQPCNC
ncbi:putative transmembrane protein [Toxoplasma gondii VAND]|uniref:Putative transmembrane protein n=2 Tax=Toxoplasma gondii TaxID=5811 RepID=A0A086JGH2_TOXGO|nr:putative transmembrane protein [Toxoplasma gondii p89]KFH13655.1 putative transmembrane protein [Toxoplasma gondii VAND]